MRKASVVLLLVGVLALLTGSVFIYWRAQGFMRERFYRDIATGNALDGLGDVVLNVHFSDPAVKIFNRQGGYFSIHMEISGQPKAQAQRYANETGEIIIPGSNELKFYGPGVVRTGVGPVGARFLSETKKTTQVATAVIIYHKASGADGIDCGVNRFPISQIGRGALDVNCDVSEWSRMSH